MRLQGSIVPSAYDTTMPKVLILFYSRTSNTAALADAIAEGARSVRFAEVSLRRIDDLAPQSKIDSVPEWKAGRERLMAKYQTFEDVNALPDYDAIILGSPTRYGVMAAELKNMLDQTGPLWRKGAFTNKVGAAFTTVSTGHGGHETTLWSIMNVMANLGMILVPPGYTDPVMFAGGSPYGATATTGGGPPGAADLAAARHEGKRVAEVVGWITHARSHAH
jgi:NAD(P)H dehydrogenase (quinone)